MNTKEFLVIVPSMLIGIILLFNLIGSMASTLTDASEAIKFSNNCSDGRDAYGIRLDYNISSGNCYNSSGNDLYPAALYPIPLSTVISGFTIVILMIGIFTFALIMIIREMRK